MQKSPILMCVLLLAFGGLDYFKDVGPSNRALENLPTQLAELNGSLKTLTETTQLQLSNVKENVLRNESAIKELNTWREALGATLGRIGDRITALELRVKTP